MSLRKAAEMALEVMEYNRANGTPNMGAAIEALRQALAQPEQEPVAWVYNGILHEFDPSEFATSEVTPLYIAPPKRKWVGLTDEEMKKTWYETKNIMGWYSFEEIARLIEAKLKEKNT